VGPRAVLDAVVKGKIPSHAHRKFLSQVKLWEVYALATKPVRLQFQINEYHGVAYNEF
jgi:hypothetical protein